MKPKDEAEPEIKDLGEIKGEDVLAVLSGHLAQLAQKAQVVRAPVPMGLGEADTLTLRLRRMEQAQGLSFIHGTTLAMAGVARQARAITHDQYAAHMRAVAQIMG